MGGKSNVGDWVFLVLCIVIITAFLGYENADTVMEWMQNLSMAEQPVQSNVADSGALSWLAANWGKAILIGSILAWGLKGFLAKRTAPPTEEGLVIKYDTFRHVKVELVN